MTAADTASPLWQAALPAGLFAGVVAVLATVAIERWGGRLGGILGTLPTTIVPASLGVLAAGGDDALRAAMWATPAGMLLNALFLWSWRAGPRLLPAAWPLGRRLSAMIALSLGVWFALALLTVRAAGAWTGAGAPLWAFGALATACIALAGTLACLRNPPAPRGHRRVPPGALLLRAALAAAAIAVSVVISRHGGPVAAGVASVFPAIFLTAMVGLWLAQGEAVPAGAVGPMMLGSSSVAAYALWAAWTMPLLGAGLGATAAWLLAALSAALPAWTLLRALERRPRT